MTRSSRLTLELMLCLVLPALMLLLAGGCYNDQLRVDGRTVDEIAIPGTTHEMQQRDIPVPGGFVLIEPESFAYTDGFRSVSLVYRAEDARVEEVASFFLSQMGNTKWTLVRDVGTSTRRLFFEKERQECVVLIQPFGYAARLQVDIHPQRT